MRDRGWTRERHRDFEFMRVMDSRCRGGECVQPSAQWDYPPVLLQMMQALQQVGLLDPDVGRQLPRLGSCEYTVASSARRLYRSMPTRVLFCLVAEVMGVTPMSMDRPAAAYLIIWQLLDNDKLLHLPRAEKI